MPRKIPPKIALAGVALIVDLVAAWKHKRRCPQCMSRDYLAIALDVAHLLESVA